MWRSGERTQGGKGGVWIDDGTGYKDECVGEGRRRGSRDG